MVDKLMTILLLFLVVLIYPSISLSGEIYGSIKIGNRYVQQGVNIKIKCNNSPITTQTDQYGSYRVRISHIGSCTLKVTYGNQTPSIKIYAYKRPVRYDLLLEKSNGRYFIKRR